MRHARLIFLLLAATTSVALFSICALSTCWRGSVCARKWCGRIDASISHGVIHFEWARGTKFVNYSTVWRLQKISLGMFEKNRKNLNYQYSSFNGDFKGYANFSVPLLIPAVALMLLTTWTWSGSSLVRRRGHCRSCGYNLFGVTSLRCPECGKAVTPELVAQARPVEPSSRSRVFLRTSAIWAGCLLVATVGATVIWTIHERTGQSTSPPGAQNAITAANKYLISLGRTQGLGAATALPFNDGWDVHYGDPDDSESVYLHIDSSGQVQASQARQAARFISQTPQAGAYPQFGLTTMPILKDDLLNPMAREVLIASALSVVRQQGGKASGFVGEVFLDRDHVSVVLEKRSALKESQVFRINNDGKPEDSTDQDLQRFIDQGAIGIATAASHPAPISP